MLPAGHRCGVCCPTSHGCLQLLGQLHCLPPAERSRLHHARLLPPWEARSPGPYAQTNRLQRQQCCKPTAHLCTDQHARGVGSTLFNLCCQPVSPASFPAALVLGTVPMLLPNQAPAHLARSSTWCLTPPGSPAPSTLSSGNSSDSELLLLLLLSRGMLLWYCTTVGVCCSACGTPAAKKWNSAQAQVRMGA